MKTFKSFFLAISLFCLDSTFSIQINQQLQVATHGSRSPCETGSIPFRQDVSVSGKDARWLSTYYSDGKLYLKASGGTIKKARFSISVQPLPALGSISSFILDYEFQEALRPPAKAGDSNTLKPHINKIKLASYHDSNKGEVITDLTTVQKRRETGNYFLIKDKSFYGSQMLRYRPKPRSIEAGKFIVLDVWIKDLQEGDILVINEASVQNTCK